MKKALALLLSIMMVFCFISCDDNSSEEQIVPKLKWDGSSSMKWVGDYEKKENFELNSAADLAGFAKFVSEGHNFEGKTVTLNNDIDLDNHKWNPIGSIRRYNTEKDKDGNYIYDETAQFPDYNKDIDTFKGTFDGQNHKISNLYINIAIGDKSAVGLFGIVGDGATIKNLTIESGEIINASDAAAGVVGMSVGDVTIDNCINKANITNDTRSNEDICGGAAAGIVARVYEIQDLHLVLNKEKLDKDEKLPLADSYNSEVTIKNCKNYGTIEGKGKSGGIVGFTDDGLLKVTITDCQNEGDIHNDNAAGGILGWGYYRNEFTLNNCKNAGTAETESNKKCGQIFGYVEGLGTEAKFTFEGNLNKEEEKLDEDSQVINKEDTK